MTLCVPLLLFCFISLKRKHHPKGKLRKKWFNRQFRVPGPWGAKHSRALASGPRWCRRSAENSGGVEAFPVWSLPQVQPTRICVSTDTFTCLNKPGSFKEFGNKPMTYCAERPFIPSSKNKIIVTLTKGQAFLVYCLNSPGTPHLPENPF